MTRAVYNIHVDVIPFRRVIFGCVKFREKLEQTLRNNIHGSKFRGAVLCSEQALCNIKSTIITVHKVRLCAVEY